MNSRGLELTGQLDGERLVIIPRAPRLELNAEGPERLDLADIARQLRRADELRLHVGAHEHDATAPPLEGAIRREHRATDDDPEEARTVLRLQVEEKLDRERRRIARR